MMFALSEANINELIASIPQVCIAISSVAGALLGLFSLLKARQSKKAIDENTSETVKAKHAAVAAVKSSSKNAEVIELVAVRVNGQRDDMIQAARVMQDRIDELEKKLADKIQLESVKEAVKETVKVVIDELKANGK